MPRRLKPYKVSTVKHSESGLRIDIFLDRNHKDFFGEVAGELVRDPTEKGCSSKAYNLCKAHVSFEWRKVVVVDTRSNRMELRPRRDTIYVAFSVHEIAPRPDGKCFERSDGTGFAGCPEFDIDRYYGNTKNDPEKGVYVLPHSDALVAALENIQQRILSMGAALGVLLGGDVERVIEAALPGALQLPAPVADKEHQP